jgi:hypothetical protein
MAQARQMDRFCSEDGNFASDIDEMALQGIQTQRRRQQDNADREIQTLQKEADATTRFGAMRARQTHRNSTERRHSKIETTEFGCLSFGNGLKLIERRILEHSAHKDTTTA